METARQGALWDDAPLADPASVIRSTSARERVGTDRTQMQDSGISGSTASDALWNIEQVAAYLGVPKQTIYCWRTTGYGPQGFRVGKHLRWRATTVIAWTVQLEHGS